MKYDKSSNTESKTYIEWIDIAKGIGIILVIAGHTFSLRLSSPLYTFHLPLFFLLSGYVYNEGKYKQAKYFFLSKTKQLLRPWAVIWIISLCVCLIIPQWRESLSMRQMVIEFYTTNTNNVQNSSIWFCICMFVCMSFFFFLNKIKRNFWSLTLLLIIALGILYLKDIEHCFSNYCIAMPDNRVPFKADSALVACVFFSLGAWFKKEIAIVVKHSNSWLLLGILSVVLYLLAYLNGWTNLNSLDFGRVPVLFYPLALFGITIVLWWAYKISESFSEESRLKKVLLFYGKYSLIIFGFQSLFIRLYLLIFNSIQGLEMQLYANNPIYHQVGSFVLVTFVISSLLVLVIIKLRKIGINVL